MRGTSTGMVARARSLRRAMSPPEVILWSLLRKRPAGVKFRRQHPVGGYVLDFYCPAARLCVEVDGIAHEMGDNPERDAARDAWLEGAGIRVARIAAGEVMRNPEGVLQDVLSKCQSSL